MQNRMSLLLEAWQILFEKYTHSDDPNSEFRAGFADLMILSNLDQLKEFDDEDAEEAEAIGAYPDYVWKKSVPEVMEQIITDGWTLTFDDDTTFGEVEQMIRAYIVEKGYIVEGHLA